MNDEDAALQAHLGEAEAALASFARGPVRRAADDMADAFERAGARIARALAGAAAGGEASFKRLAKTILEELAKVALDRIFDGARPLPSARPGVAATVQPSGQSIAGAQPRGPAAPAPVSVHFHLGAGADADGVMRHQGQIAAAVARAVAYGRRNL